MEALLAGRLTFKVKNAHDEIVNGTVVQYPSDQKYYVQAEGSMLWQVQPIQHNSNTVILSPSQTIQSGFTLTDVVVNNPPVRFGFCMSNDKAYLAVKMLDNTLRVLSYEDKLPYGVLNVETGDFEFTPSPYTLGDHLEFVNNDSINDAPYDVLPCRIQENEEYNMVVIVDNKQFNFDLVTGDESPMSIYDQLNV